MPRILVLFLLFLASAELPLAQSSSFRYDPAYLPFEVGNRWEYWVGRQEWDEEQGRNGDALVPIELEGYMSWEVVGDTLVEDKTYFVMVGKRYDRNGAQTSSTTCHVFKRTFSFGGGRIDAFPASCLDFHNSFFGGGALTWWDDMSVSGYSEESTTAIRIGEERIPVDGSIRMSMDYSRGNGLSVYLATDVGFYSMLEYFGNPYGRALRVDLGYARIGDREVGAPLIGSPYSASYLTVESSFSSAIAAGGPYPNPADRFVTVPVSFAGYDQSDIRAVVYDAAGRRVQESKLTVSDESCNRYPCARPNGGSVTIPTSELPSGVYFVRILHDSNPPASLSFVRRLAATSFVVVH